MFRRWRLLGAKSLRDGLVWFGWLVVVVDLGLLEGRLGGSLAVSIRMYIYTCVVPSRLSSYLSFFHSFSLLFIHAYSSRGESGRQVSELPE